MKSPLVSGNVWQLCAFVALLSQTHTVVAHVRVRHFVRVVSETNRDPSLLRIMVHVSAVSFQWYRILKPHRQENRLNCGQD